MKKPILVSFIAVLIIMSIISCKKQGNIITAGPGFSQHFPANISGCYISKITIAGGLYRGIYTFSYNDNGTVSAINGNVDTFASDNYILKFLYFPNAIVVQTIFYNSSSPAYYDSLILDNNNRVTTIYAYGTNGGFTKYPANPSTTYQYDSVGNMVLVTNYNYSTISTANYYWKNGDLQWNTVGTDQYTYIYDSSLYNTGNIKTGIIDFLKYGRPIFTTRHIHTMAIQNGRDSIGYIYTRDADGKIINIKQVEPGNYISTTQIDYNCK